MRVLACHPQLERSLFTVLHFAAPSSLQRRVQLFATTSSDKPLVPRLLLLGRKALDNKKWGQKALQTGLVRMAGLACCVVRHSTMLEDAPVKAVPVSSLRSVHACWHPCVQVAPQAGSLRLLLCLQAAGFPLLCQAICDKVYGSDDELARLAAAVGVDEGALRQLRSKLKGGSWLAARRVPACEARSPSLLLVHAP